MAEQNFDPVTRRFYTPGSAGNVSFKGDMAGKDADFDEMKLQEWTNEFNKSYPGASGIAGARVRVTPAYKKALAEFIAKKRAPKPAPSPSPAAAPGLSLGEIVAAVEGE